MHEAHTSSATYVVRLIGRAVEREWRTNRFLRMDVRGVELIV